MSGQEERNIGRLRLISQRYVDIWKSKDTGVCHCTNDVWRDRQSAGVLVGVVLWLDRDIWLKVVLPAVFEDPTQSAHLFAAVLESARDNASHQLFAPLTHSL